MKKPKGRNQKGPSQRNQPSASRPETKPAPPETGASQRIKSTSVATPWRAIVPHSSTLWRQAAAIAAASIVIGLAFNATNPIGIRFASKSPSTPNNQKVTNPSPLATNTLVALASPPVVSPVDSTQTNQA